MMFHEDSGLPLLLLLGALSRQFCGFRVYSTTRGTTVFFLVLLVDGEFFVGFSRTSKSSKRFFTKFEIWGKLFKKENFFQLEKNTE